MNNQNYTIVDVETTGGSPYHSRVIEIGILRVEKGEIVAKYQTLLNPETEIPEFITKLTGLKDSDVALAPKFNEVKDEILELFEDSIFVAHNVGFDYEFIRQEFRRVGYGFTAEQLCTVRLSRALFPKEKHHNLSVLIERFEIACDNRHRAFDDAKVLWDFLQIVQSKFSKDELDSAIKKSHHPTTRRNKKDVKFPNDLEYILLED